MSLSKYLLFSAAAGVLAMSCSDALAVEAAAAAPQGLPPLSRYEPPAFPQSLRLTSIADGYVTVLLAVGSDGGVEDAVAIEASHPAFANAVGEVLKKWRFEQAASSTVPRRELIQFDFRRSGMVAALSQREASKALFANAAQPLPAISTVNWEQLLQPPQRTTGAVPAYPQALRSQSRTGSATVDFVIDTNGEIRVPAVTAASDPLFAEEALRAVKQWRFEAPLQDGRAVNVRMTRSFNFGSGSTPRRTAP